MSSCCGYGRRGKRQDDEEALLAEYDDETVLQRRVHQKMHSYQMLRALAAGYMPSNEQLIVNLRSLLASDVLNPAEPELSEDGRRLVKECKRWLQDFMRLLKDKNGEDEVQDFVWALSHARVQVNTHDVSQRVKTNRAKADATAGRSRSDYIVEMLIISVSLRESPYYWQPFVDEFRFPHLP